MPIDLDFCKVVEPTRTINKVCALIMKNDRVFAFKKGQCVESEVKWEFPSWKYEIKDYLLYADDALKRKIKENFNNDIKMEYPLGEFDYFYEDKHLHIKMKAYECKLISENFELIEYTDSRWFSIDELDSVIWTDENKEVVEAVKKWLEKKRYILAIDKENSIVGDIYGGWKYNYEVVKNNLDVIWDGKISLVEIYRMYINEIKKMQRDCFEIKKRDKWLVIRVYNEQGEQIWQQS